MHDADGIRRLGTLASLSVVLFPGLWARDLAARVDAGHARASKVVRLSFFGGFITGEVAIEVREEDRASTDWRQVAVISALALSAAMLAGIF